MTNVSDRKEVRRLEKESRQADRTRAEVIIGLMGMAAGRSYVYDHLAKCHLFNTSMSLEALAMAFSEGERNIGLQMFNDIMIACPEKFTLMIQERNAANVTNVTVAERSRGQDADGGVETGFDFADAGTEDGAEGRGQSRANGEDRLIKYD